MGDMCVRHSSASKSKSVKIGIPSKPPPSLKLQSNTGQSVSTSLNGESYSYYYSWPDQSISEILMTRIFLFSVPSYTVENFLSVQSSKK